MLVFVYGTLADPERVAAVLDEWRFEGDAVIEGLRRVDGEYPTLAPGGRVTGRLLRTPETERLDAYEGVDRSLYVRVTVPGATGSAEVYVGDPEKLDAPAEWPGDEVNSFADRVRAYVDANGVRVRTTTIGH